jgi:hypothetical protein
MTIAKAALFAAAVMSTPQAYAATITYNGSCRGFCSFAKVNGTVNSVRIDHTLTGSQGFAPAAFGPEPSIYRVTGIADVSGGKDVAFDFNAVVSGFGELTISYAISISQLVTENLSYYQGQGLFEAGGFIIPTYTYVSGDYRIGAPTSGRPFMTPISITIDFTPAVPEPATWALMLAGFGMVGYAMRRCRPQIGYA